MSSIPKTALKRIQKEISMFEEDPGPGIKLEPVLGPVDSAYEEGVFRISIQIPHRYPFEPPRARFTTPIYHPNIDSDGRICLDTLKLPPQGTWSPSVNINTLLLSIRLLLAHPNAEDGLVPEITNEYTSRYMEWLEKAKLHTKNHATNLSWGNDTDTSCETGKSKQGCKISGSSDKESGSKRQKIGV